MLMSHAGQQHIVMIIIVTVMFRGWRSPLTLHTY